MPCLQKETAENQQQDPEEDPLPMPQKLTSVTPHLSEQLVKVQKIKVKYLRYQEDHLGSHQHKRWDHLEVAQYPSQDTWTE